MSFVSRSLHAPLKFALRQTLCCFFHNCGLGKLSLFDPQVSKLNEGVYAGTVKKCILCVGYIFNSTLLGGYY